MKNKTERKTQGVEALAPGMQPTKEISKNQLAQNEQENVPQPETDRWEDNASNLDVREKTKTYNRMEMGSLDEDSVPDSRNPHAAQGGQGPLNQDGEGNRQNDEMAELESIDPDIA